MRKYFYHLTFDISKSDAIKIHRDLSELLNRRKTRRRRIKRLLDKDYGGKRW